MDQTKQPEFEKDPAWETVDQQPAYTHEEYLEFERRRQQEIQHMIQQGLVSYWVALKLYTVFRVF